MAERALIVVVDNESDALAAMLDALTRRYDLSEVPLSAALCTSAALLPPIHRDPCDRFIIAAAKSLGVPVVTIDSRFEEYGVQVLS